MPNEHAEFSPSASERWLVCPASVPLSKGKSNGDTIHTVKGTAIHDLAEQFLREWTHIDYIENDHGAIACILNKGQDDEETIVIPPEEWRPHIVPYIKAVRADYQRWKDQGLDVKLLIEERVTIDGSKCWGSCDAAVVVPGWYVGGYDLKTGKGKIVSAGNTQNLCYLAGLAQKFDWDFVEYKAYIAQEANSEPDNIDTHESSEKELKAHLKRVKKAIKSAPKAEPGPIGDHCGWCPHKAECAAHHQAVIAVFNEDQEIQDPKEEMKAAVSTLTDTKMQWIMEHLGAMRGFLDDVEAEAKKRMLMGEEIPGFKVVMSKTKRRWRKDKTVEEIAAELELYDVEEPLVEQPKKLLGIGEVEKIIGKGQLSALTETPEGQPVVAPESDKRQAISIFEKLDANAKA